MYSGKFLSQTCPYALANYLTLKIRFYGPVLSTPPPPPLHDNFLLWGQRGVWSAYSASLGRTDNESDVQI